MTTSPPFTAGLPPFLTRSWLVIPAGGDAALFAGARSGADVLVLDIGSLPAVDQPDAAARVLGFLRTCRENPSSATPALFVLLPPPDLGGASLLETLAPGAPDGLVLAGAMVAADIQHLDVLLGVHEAENGLPQGQTAIAAFLPLAPRHSVSGISRRLVALGFDADALAHLLGASRMHDESGLLTDAFRCARAEILLAAASAGLEAIDAASGIFSSERLGRDCREAAADGFSGKTALSPRQVSAINHAFSPTADALAEARSLLDGPAHADPRLIARARRMIRRAELERR